jgi:hypothetical protein
MCREEYEWKLFGNVIIKGFGSQQGQHGPDGVPGKNGRPGVDGYPGQKGDDVLIAKESLRGDAGLDGYP